VVPINGGGSKLKYRIILPLDHVPWNDAREIMAAARGMVWGYKIRRSVLERGLDVIHEIKEYGNVMLDFKLYDIPSAMSESLKMHFNAGADITTVHCTACYDPSEGGLDKAGLAGVSILTSMGKEEFKHYYQGEEIADMVAKMAQEAQSRYEYLVCSANDLDRIGHLNIKKICPGIRPRWHQAPDDQTRTATPEEAIRNGADLLVIGRPILQAEDMIDALKRTNEEIENA
jgi:orotidine-5'-phosphate decarboxylase